MYLGELVSWNLGDSLASLQPSDLLWIGGDGFVRGAWRPPSFMEKLIVESGIKVTGELGVSLGSLVVVSQVVPVRDLVAGKQYSC